jgi:hypothetical protein
VDGVRFKERVNVHPLQHILASKYNFKRDVNNKRHFIDLTNVAAYDA